MKDLYFKSNNIQV